MKTDPKLSGPFADGGPGAHLRRAREAANMSVADVADALFLHPDKIEALESDTFDRLAAPTFVRGYLHGYARVLGLPPAPILDMYDRQGFGPPPLAPDGSETKQAHTSDLPVRLATYAVGAVLVLLVGLWWRSQGDAGFDVGDALLGWWSDAVIEPLFPGAGAPATAPAGDDAGGGSIAAAPDRIGEPLRRDEPPASSPAGGPATAGIPPGTTAPDGSDTGGRTVATAPDRAGGPPQGGEPPASSPAEGPATAGIPPGTTAPDGSDNTGGRTVATAPDRTGGPAQGGEPPASSSAEGPATAGIPLGTTAPDGSDTGDRTVATAPDRTGGPPQGGEPPASSPAEGPTIAGAGPAPAEGAGPGAMTDREASATPEPRPEAGTGTDPAAGTDPDGAGRPETPAPRETRHADATDGPDATAAPEAVAPPSIPETSPSETASAPTDIAAGATAVAGTARPGLVLAFVHESWVEVFDRERTRLFFGLVQPGRVLDFEGPQPFDVLLGNSKDVRVAIDGEVFDHTPYSRHGVARFSVGAAPSGGADSAEPPDTVATGAADSREASSRPRDGNSR